MPSAVRGPSAPSIAGYATSSSAVRCASKPCVDAAVYAPDPLDDTAKASADDTDLIDDDDDDDEDEIPISRSVPDSHTTVSMPDTTARGYANVTRPGTAYDTDPT